VNWKQRWAIHIFALFKVFGASRSMTTGCESASGRCRCPSYFLVGCPASAFGGVAGAEGDVSFLIFFPEKPSGVSYGMVHLFSSPECA